MKQINPEHLDALLALINASPFFKLLDMKVCELRNHPNRPQHMPLSGSSDRRCRKADCPRHVEINGFAGKTIRFTSRPGDEGSGASAEIHRIIRRGDSTCTVSGSAIVQFVSGRCQNENYPKFRISDRQQ